MTLVWTIAALLAPAAAGWFLVRALWPAHPRRGEAFLLRSSIALALGFALASAHFMLWRMACHHLPLLYRFSDCLLLPALAFFAARVRSGFEISRWGGTACLQAVSSPEPTRVASNPCHPMHGRRPDGSTPAFRRIAVAALLIITLIAALAALALSAGYGFREPLGQWDAWAIWNLKAKFLAADGPAWQGIFSRTVWFSHPDYPLLLPAAVARIWLYTGAQSALVPQFIALGFTALVMMLLFGAVHFLSGIVSAGFATLLLCASEIYLYYGGMQLADVPLSLYLLASLCTLAIAGRSDRPASLLLLAGLAAGCAAFTKHEGLVFVVALLPAVFLVGGVSRSRQRSTLILLAGMLPLFLLLATQKYLYPTESYLTADQPSSDAIFHKLIDPARHRLILDTLRDWNFGMHQWKSTSGANPITIPRQPQLLLLLLLPLAGGLRRDRRDRFAIRTSFLTLALCLAGYYTILLIMPYDLSLLLGSWPRYQSQLWPALIFTVFLASGLSGQAPEPAPIVEELAADTATTV
jgi:hypothetical protein